ncbi:MAG: flavin reductase family protein [Xanthobacteraceae bacterium]
MIGPDEFKKGMRRLAAGVSLITTVKDGVPYGLVATSASAMTSEPPTLLVCINRSASCHDQISEAGIFCINVLEQEDVALAALFSNSQRRHERFDEGAWQSLKTGAPVLQSSAVAFDCVVDKAISYETHTIFIGRIKAMVCKDSDVDPLVYLNGSFRKLATEPKPEIGHRAPS